MKPRKYLAQLFLSAAVACLLFSQIEMASSQFGGGTFGGTFRASDPGVRGGSPGSGFAMAGLSATEAALFTDGQATFKEVDAVSDGLGPRMNLDSCAGCHAQPAAGGSSPFVNPQVAFAA